MPTFLSCIFLLCFLHYFSPYCFSRNKPRWLLSWFVLLTAICFPANCYYKHQLEFLNYNILNFLEQLINFRCGHSTGILTWKEKAGTEMKLFSKYFLQFNLLPFYSLISEIFTIRNWLQWAHGFFWFWKYIIFSGQNIPIQQWEKIRRHHNHICHCRHYSWDALHVSESKNVCATNTFSWNCAFSNRCNLEAASSKRNKG